MAIYCTILRIASMLLNLLCNTVVPIAESIALKFRIGNCPCPAVGRNAGSSSPDIELRGKVRRGKARKCEENGRSRRREGNEVKRLKLLVDVIVTQREYEEQEVEVKEIARYVDHNHSEKEGFFVRIFNIPSTVILYFTSKLRRWAHDLDNFENKSCNICENNRVKKSPKRRISRANYRKIIPFFPFNLLGFSNYSAFQMPTLTHCGKSLEEMNNLNVSTVSERCKRPRSSSSSDDDDSDFSHLEAPETEYQKNVTVAGVDEVDSDESADTVTKPVTSSQSSSKDVSPTKNRESDLAEEQDGDAKVVKGFLQELDEAANENYRSEDDSDYVPENLETSSSSYVTDSVSDESFLASSRKEEEDETVEPRHQSITSAVEASVRGNRKSASSLHISSPHNLNQDKAHNGFSNLQNGHNEENGNETVTWTGVDDEYKTPEESEHEGFPTLKK